MNQGPFETRETEDVLSSYGISYRSAPTRNSPMPNDDIMVENREEVVVEEATLKKSRQSSSSSRTSLSEDSDKCESHEKKADERIQLRNTSDNEDELESLSAKCLQEKMAHLSLNEGNNEQKTSVAPCEATEKEQNEDTISSDESDTNHELTPSQVRVRQTMGSRRTAELPQPSRRASNNEGISQNSRTIHRENRSQRESPTDKIDQQQPRKRGRPRNSGPADRSGKGYREIRPRVGGPNHSCVDAEDIYTVRAVAINVGGKEAPIYGNNGLARSAINGNIEKFMAELRFAIINGDVKLLNAENSINQTSFFIWAKKGHERGMRLAAAAGADVNRPGRVLIKDSSGQIKQSLLKPPLHHIVTLGNVDLLQKFLTFTKPNLHLDQCAECGKSDPNSGLTALASIVVSGDESLIPMLEPLMLAGADPFHRIRTNFHANVTPMALAFMRPERVKFALALIKIQEKIRGAQSLSELNSLVNIYCSKTSMNIQGTHLDIAKHGLVNYTEDQNSVTKMRELVECCEIRDFNISRVNQQAEDVREKIDELRRLVNGRSPISDNGSDIPTSPNFSVITNSPQPEPSPATLEYITGLSPICTKPHDSYYAGPQQNFATTSANTYEIRASTLANPIYHPTINSAPPPSTMYAGEQTGITPETVPVNVEGKVILVSINDLNDTNNSFVQELLDVVDNSDRRTAMQESFGAPPFVRQHEEFRIVGN